MERFIDLYSLIGEGWEEWWKTTVGSAQGQHEGVCNWEGGRGLFSKGMIGYCLIFVL